MIQGDLEAQDSARVAENLIYLGNRGNSVLPASSNRLLRPGGQNTTPVSSHSVT